MKEIMAQLAIMIACTKGADKIGGLMESLEESGNPQLVSALQTWVKDDFGVGTESVPCQGQVKVTTGNTLTSSEQLTQQKESTTELSSSRAKLIDKELNEQLEGHLIGKSSKTSDTKQKNYPISVKSLAMQRNAESCRSTFFNQTAHPYGLSKLGTLNCQQKSGTKGVPSAQFDKQRMIACAADGTLNLWNWRGGEEESIQIAVNVKNITCFQYDEEILVLGTADGSVHLFDVTTYEEKSSVKLNCERVISLEFIESTVIVITTGVCQVWRIDILRPDMRLINQRSLRVMGAGAGKNAILGVRMYQDVIFVYGGVYVDVHEANSGSMVKDDKNLPCCLVAPYPINVLNVGDLISRKRVVVAVCPNSRIVMWYTSKLWHEQNPVKTLCGHDDAIVSLCFLYGHLLSLDRSGKLLMWPGHDLEKKKVIAVPRLLLEESAWKFVGAHERWFATCSSTDDIISIWSVPDLWLRTG